MSAITKRSCEGCRNNFYNGEGAAECWSFKDASMEKRIRIHRDAMPPYHNAKPKWYPACYHALGWVFVKPEAITKEGFWK